jgi:hypothetical protein
MVSIITTDCIEDDARGCRSPRSMVTIITRPHLEHRA